MMGEVRELLRLTIAAALIGIAVFHTRASQGQTLAATPPAASAISGPQFTISHLASDQKWRSGMNSRSYDRIAQEIEDFLVQRLTSTGLSHVESLNAPCCKATLEVVEAGVRMGGTGKVGLELIVKIGVQDASGRQLYSRAYRSYVNSGVHTGGGMLDKAEKEWVDTVLKDEELMRVLGPPGS